MARGDRERAETQMKPFLAHFGGLARVQSLAGLMAISRNDRIAARKAFEAALKIDPADTEALSGLTVVDLAEGKRVEATGRIEARLTAAPTDKAALALAGRTYGGFGQAPAAERAWRNLLELDPTNIEAYGALGSLYYGQKKLGEARQEFERLAKQRPKSVGAQTMVAFLYEMDGNKAEAQKRYEKALEIDPRAAVAANNLAWLYCENGANLEVALQLAQTAKSGLPEAPEVNDTLGWIYYKKGMASMAVGPLLQAADKSPKNAVIQFHAGMALAKAGDKPQARQKLEAALALDPTFAGADEARKTLASLK
jgi:tetratricopeptide (TPR) repeat protein